MASDFATSIFEYSYTVIIVAFVYYFLTRSFTIHSRKKLFLHWLLFGFLVNLYGLSWLYAVYPLPWLAPGAIQIIGIGLLHLILSICTAIPYTVIAYSNQKRIRKNFLPLTFASLFVIAEMVRALIISLLYYKIGESTIGLHFTAGTIGNALSTTPLIEFAYFGGTFALTFILGYIVYVVSSHERLLLYWKHLVAILVLLLCIHFLVPVTMPKPGTSVGIVTTNFEMPKNVENLGQAFKDQEEIIHVMTLSLASSTKKSFPNLIVYPEDTRYLSNLTPTHKTDLLIAFGNTLFIDGDTLQRKGGLSNATLFYLQKEERYFSRGKEFLLPFNEYIPTFFEKIFSLFIQKDALITYTKLHTFSPQYSRKTVVFEGNRIDTLLCSEILSYSTIQELKAENPSIVFFQSRLDVFHNNVWFLMHLRSFTKVAAAQLRTTIISSTSGAPSIIVSPYGRIDRFTETGLSTSTYIFK